eukprot:TRINITY_DN14457_c0_g1_i1.p1 TRINITY_DN14457_c0_g1~~TRINITY_DN14457_c0_g1_i1.p1  ORF type:complete len:774 (-),score=149.37 TRINITY_DN14457_c0_g1_i1:152-2473(-)
MAGPGMATERTPSRPRSAPRHRGSTNARRAWALSNQAGGPGAPTLGQGIPEQIMMMPQKPLPQPGGQVLGISGAPLLNGIQPADYRPGPQVRPDSRLSCRGGNAPVNTVAHAAPGGGFSGVAFLPGCTAGGATGSRPASRTGMAGGARKPTPEVNYNPQDGLNLLSNGGHPAAPQRPPSTRRASAPRPNRCWGSSVSPSPDIFAGTQLQGHSATAAGDLQLQQQQQAPADAAEAAAPALQAEHVSLPPATGRERQPVGGNAEAQQPMFDRQRTQPVRPSSAHRVGGKVGAGMDYTTSQPTPPTQTPSPHTARQVSEDGRSEVSVGSSRNTNAPGALGAAAAAAVPPGGGNDDLLLAVALPRSLTAAGGGSAAARGLSAGGREAATGLLAEARKDGSHNASWPSVPEHGELMGKLPPPSQPAPKPSKEPATGSHPLDASIETMATVKGGSGGSKVDVEADADATEDTTPLASPLAEGGEHIHGSEGSDLNAGGNQDAVGGGAAASSAGAAASSGQAAAAVEEVDPRLWGEGTLVGAEDLPVVGATGVLVLPRESTMKMARGISQEDDIFLDLLDDMSGWGASCAREDALLPDRRYAHIQAEKRISEYMVAEAAGATAATRGSEVDKDACEFTSAELATLDELPVRPYNGPTMSQLARDPRRREECPICAQEWSRALETLGAKDGQPMDPMSARRRPHPKDRVHSIRCNWAWFQQSLCSIMAAFRFDAEGMPRNQAPAMHTIFPPSMADVLQYWKSKAGKAKLDALGDRAPNVQV